MRDVWNALAGDDITALGDKAAQPWLKALAIVDLGSNFADPLKGAGETVAKIAVKKSAEAVAKRIAETTGIDAAKDASHAAYVDSLRADMEKPVVSDPRLKFLVNELYRADAKIGSGSTAAAIRKEMREGVKVGNKRHSQKAEQMIEPLQKWLDTSPKARPGDRAAAENIIRDMLNALKGN